MSNVTSKLVNSVRQAKQQKTQISDTADTDTPKSAQSADNTKVKSRKNSNEEKLQMQSTLISSDNGNNDQQSLFERVWPD